MDRKPVQGESAKARPGQEKRKTNPPHVVASLRMNQPRQCGCCLALDGSPGVYSIQGAEKLN